MPVIVLTVESDFNLKITSVYRHQKGFSLPLMPSGQRKMSIIVVPTVAEASSQYKPFDFHVLFSNHHSQSPLMALMRETVSD